jgi:hypothetical protein
MDMGRSALLALVGLALSANAAHSDQIAGTQRNVLGWQLAAYDKPGGAFSHCGMYIPYRSGITMHYAIFANYQWRVGWSHPSWNLTPNQQVPISIVVDNAAPYNLTAFAINKSLAAADLPPTAAVFDLMRKGYQMRVYAQGNQYAFDLGGTYAALTELVSCVGQFAKPTQPPAAPVAGDQGTEPKTAASLPAELRLEATTLVANLLSQGDLTGYHILTAQEIQSLNNPALATWHAVWREGNILGAMKIVPAAPGRTAATLSTELIADDSRNCSNGKFASGTSPDGKSPGTIRLYTACVTDKVSWEAHYIVVPRDAGGQYLFGTFGLIKDQETTTVLDRADGALRAAVFQVLKH